MPLSRPITPSRTKPIFHGNDIASGKVSRQSGLSRRPRGVSRWPKAIQSSQATLSVGGYRSLPRGLCRDRITLFKSQSG
jgi:hypothetical protein